MIKKDIIEKVEKNTGLNKKLVKRVINEFLSVLSDSLKEGERVEIRNFGIFKVKKVKEKLGRNPKTGEEIIIPQHFKIVFKPSKVFKKNP